MNKKIKNMRTKQEKINALESMIDSCFTYGGASREAYNFERYILPHKKELGEKLFEKTYNDRMATLQKDYEVEQCVYTDSEGGMYNSLKLKA
jgi:hypothetical protein